MQFVCYKCNLCVTNAICVSYTTFVHIVNVLFLHNRIVKQTKKLVIAYHCAYLYNISQSDSFS